MTQTQTNLHQELEKYSGICYDSRAVKKGYIFVCIKGEKVDGHKFIDQAVASGASLIVLENGALSSDEIKILKESKPELEILFVDDTRSELALLSSLFYGEPSKHLSVIGITGTNGKTTVSHLIQHILSAKAPCASLGTIGFRETIKSDYVDLGNTTPQSTDLQRIFKEQLDKGCQSLTMEVSSHALDQARVDAINFKTVIVTNLSQDHLDYHRTMDHYFKAKARIFDLVEKAVILNVDDDYYERFHTAALSASYAKTKELRTITYGVNNAADLKAENLDFSDNGLSFDLVLSHNAFKLFPQLGEDKASDANLSLKSEPIRFNLKLNGLFNVYNSLAAIAACLEEGLEIATIKKALEATPPVAGRFEVLKTEKSPMCIVDYAHSPDGLDNILRGAQAITKEGSKLICLFGCGGDRDITKRPKMAKIAYDLADYLYVTSDNPRSEDPDQIIADILSGIPNLENAKVIPDREQAIKEAVLNSSKEDVVVIAGKGHEDYQILADRTIHFDDREQVQKAIDSL